MNKRDAARFPTRCRRVVEKIRADAEFRLIGGAPLPEDVVEGFAWFNALDARCLVHEARQYGLLG